MFKWLVANSFAQRQINDFLQGAGYAAAAWLATNHVVSNSMAQNQAAGAIIFLLSLGWQWIENTIQNTRQQH